MPETDSRTLRTRDGDMALFEARPDRPARGAVVVVQEAFGVNDHIRDVTRRFAAAGYHAVAPALFHRAGGGTAPYGELAKVVPLFAGLDDAAILVDLDATLDHLRCMGFRDEAIGVVGFCFGGRASFLAAARRRLGAAVGFYGGGIVKARRAQFPALVGEAGTVRTPWLGLFGDRDASIPIEDVEALREALKQAPVASAIVRYPEGLHGFHCDVRPEYHAASAKDAWVRTLDWLSIHLAAD